MMAKPIRALELHYPMIQFLIKEHITWGLVLEPFQSKIWGMIIIEIVAAFFIEIGQGCMVSGTLIGIG